MLAAMSARVALLLALLVAAAPARAAEPALPVLDLARLPPLQAGGVEAYQAFLLEGIHRAFAVSDRGAWGISVSRDRFEDAAADALAACAARTAGPCRLIAADNRPGATPDPPTDRHPVAAAYADPEYPWFGPAAAKGILLWSHGGGRRPELITPYPAAFARYFSNAGWDVYRFERELARETTGETLALYRQTVQALRSAGYARVIGAGHSAGAWTILTALDTPGLLDGAILASLARHGTNRPDNPNFARALPDYQALMARVADPAVRMAVLLFAGDPFDPGPQRRAEIATELLLGHGNPTFVLAEPPGVSGHMAGLEPEFSRRYGACLLEFMTGPAVPLFTCRAAAPAG